MKTIARVLLGTACCVMLAGCATVSPNMTALSKTAPAPAVPEVTIADGTLVGVHSGAVDYFKGIPYAAPPVGKLRWASPQPASAWSGVREAKTYAHDCMQKPFPEDAAPLRTTPSEDCLYLNVWRPANATKKLPVMVWIHGGGFVNGGSSPAVYDGTHFAEDGIVFVSFNYRLGRFGFFGFPALTAEDPNGLHGNYGYMDQIAALKWVRKNIAAFGGDPDNVMVFGESAGGGSVHMLLSSPGARGLFERAAVESGGGRGNLMGPRQLSKDLPGAPSSDTLGVNFAKANGIEGTGPDALAKLRALSADQVTDGLNMGSMQATSGPLTYGGPMEDGKIVAMSPEQAYESGEEAHVPILIGANSADLGFFFPKTKKEAFAAYGKDAAAARKAYDPDGDKPLRAMAWEMGMDQMMVEPARFTVREFSKQGEPAYEYRFSYVAPAEQKALNQSAFAKMMGIKGAPHASEIPYVFDTVKAAYSKDTTPADEATAKEVHAYWANFAKHGNPNGPGVPHWPHYNALTDMLMNFKEAGPTPMADPWATRLNVTAERADALQKKMPKKPAS